MGRSYSTLPWVPAALPWVPNGNFLVNHRPEAAIRSTTTQRHDKNFSTVIDTHDFAVTNGIRLFEKILVLGVSPSPRRRPEFISGAFRQRLDTGMHHNAALSVFPSKKF
jgi:hypothetical protein